MKTLKPFELGAHLDLLLSHCTVTRAGVVFNKAGRELQQRTLKKRQLRTVDVSANGEQVRAYVHVLVALAHVSKGLGHTQSVLHRDQNFANNDADNLEWFSPISDAVCRHCLRPLPDSPVATRAAQLQSAYAP